MVERFEFKVPTGWHIKIRDTAFPGTGFKCGPCFVFVFVFDIGDQRQDCCYFCFKYVQSGVFGLWRFAKTEVQVELLYHQSLNNPFFQVYRFIRNYNLMHGALELNELVGRQFT